jgi:hypothetical protein
MTQRQRERALRETREAKSIDNSGTQERDVAWDSSNDDLARMPMVKKWHNPPYLIHMLSSVGAFI